MVATEQIGVPVDSNQELRSLTWSDYQFLTHLIILKPKGIWFSELALPDGRVVDAKEIYAQCWQQIHQILYSESISLLLAYDFGSGQITFFHAINEQTRN